MRCARTRMFFSFRSGRHFKNRHFYNQFSAQICIHACTHSKRGEATHRERERDTNARVPIASFRRHGDTHSPRILPQHLLLLLLALTSKDPLQPPKQRLHQLLRLHVLDRIDGPQPLLLRPRHGQFGLPYLEIRRPLAHEHLDAHVLGHLELGIIPPGLPPAPLVRFDVLPGVVTEDVIPRQSDRRAGDRGRIISHGDAVSSYLDVLEGDAVLLLLRLRLLRRLRGGAGRQGSLHVRRRRTSAQ
mmetsp:Transcript_53128/g.158983  ORF Transcript_53128/g.158983 Transcript_53128/m.158983 type:complete len:244 (-) Transcript_53128:653-1384(-)